MATITIYAGITGRTKNVGEGFAMIGRRSALIFSGEIYTRPAIEDELEVEPEDKWFICIPSSCLGRAYLMECKRIGCKSEGQAEHILHRKGFVGDLLKNSNWFATPQAAAKHAYEKLLEEARFNAEKPTTVDEAIGRLRTAGLLDSQHSLSSKWFKKPQSRKRVALALRGDKQSIGLIHRDSFVIS